MVTTSWADINKDGRRLETIIKSCFTKFKNTKNPMLQLAYVDRIIKATHEKVEVAKIVLRVDEVLKVKTIEQPFNLVVVSPTSSKG